MGAREPAPSPSDRGADRFYQIRVSHTTNLTKQAYAW
ncbi:MAG: hypothetical protein QOE61_121 [Micromonosporaceae bacterium]|nr:hypothetical protein [Micromonosporaceae bacterium]